MQRKSIDSDNIAVRDCPSGSERAVQKNRWMTDSSAAFALFLLFLLLLQPLMKPIDSSGVIDS